MPFGPLLRSALQEGKNLKVVLNGTEIRKTENEMAFKEPWGFLGRLTIDAEYDYEPRQIGSAWMLPGEEVAKVCAASQ